MKVGQQLQDQLIYFCSWWENDNGFGISLKFNYTAKWLHGAKSFNGIRICILQ